MNILPPQVVKDRKQAEIAKDIARTETVKKQLEKVTTQLNELNAKFNVALANQRIRWSLEEEEHNQRVVALRKEIEVLEKQRLTYPN